MYYPKFSLFKILFLQVLFLPWSFAQLSSVSEPLSDEALIYKCFAHLTGVRPPLTHPLIVKVKSGQIKGSQACEDLMDQIQLKSNGLVDSSDAIKKADGINALNHFYRLQKLYIGSQDYCTSLPDAGQYCDGLTDVLDASIPSIILTEAVLNPQRKFSEVFTLSRVPRAERELSSNSKFIQYSARLARGFMNISPGGANYNATLYRTAGFLNSIIIPDLLINVTTPSIVQYNVIDLNAATNSFGIDNNLKAGTESSYAAETDRVKIGSLNGIVYDSNYSLRFPSVAAKDVYFKADGLTIAPIDLRRTLDTKFSDPEGPGGGIFSTQEYMMLNFGWSYNFKADGAVNMPRRWVQSLFSDFLCRSLPVVRETDARPLVLNSSNMPEADLVKAGPFRLASNCTSCHATMDQLAGVARNISWHTPSFTNDNNAPGATIRLFQWPVDTTLDASTNKQWRNIALAAPAFHRLPTLGKLFYRSFDGRLIDIQVNSLKDLGQKISELDDAYVCAVKKQFKNLTNIDVSLHDVGDTANAGLNSSMSEEDWEKRNFVISLGKDLKSHQKLSTTIKQIIKSKYFSQRVKYISSSTESQ